MKISLNISRKHFGIPFALFAALFVVLPLCFIIVFAFTGEDGSFTFSNFALFGGGNLRVLLMSVGVGALTTLFCLLIGYPIALILSRKIYFKSSATLVMLFIIPMWVNFLLRTLAAKFLFEFIGVHMGYFTVIFGMVYDFLPFMILPLYITLTNMDKNLLEAAQDLGANSFRTFVTTVLPLSVPGIISGVLMVFMPSLSTIAITDIMSNQKIKLFGNLIDLWMTNDSWNIGSALSLVLLLVIGLSMYLNNKYNRGGASRAGLW